MADAQAIGNAFRITATGWDRQRIFQGRYTRGEIGTLVIDYNGIMLPGETIAQAKFQMAQTYIVIMSNPAIRSDQRSCQVDIQANYPNDTMFKCTVLTSTGRSLVQTARLQVDDTYWFDGDTVNQNGPTEFIVTA